MTSSIEGVSAHYARHALSFLDDTTVADAQGGCTLKNVILLAEGEWQDSLSEYPVKYTPDNLAAFVVEDTTGYRTHAWGRGMDEEIGEALRIWYDPAQKAIMADLYLHGLTQASRDVIAAITHRQTTNRRSFVSIEMYTRDVPRDGGYVAETIRIVGWIATSNPACTKCAIPKQQSAAQPPKTETMTNTPEDKDQPSYVTPDQMAAAVTRIATLEARADPTLAIKALEAKVAELTAANVELSKALAAADTRVKALEASGPGRLPLVENESPKIYSAPIAELHTRKGGY